MNISPWEYPECDLHLNLLGLMSEIDMERNLLFEDCQDRCQNQIAKAMAMATGANRAMVQ